VKIGLKLEEYEVVALRRLLDPARLAGEDAAVAQGMLQVIEDAKKLEWQSATQDLWARDEELAFVTVSLQVSLAWWVLGILERCESFGDHALQHLGVGSKQVQEMSLLRLRLHKTVMCEEREYHCGCYLLSQVPVPDNRALRWWIDVGEYQLLTRALSIALHWPQQFNLDDDVQAWQDLASLHQTLLTDGDKAMQTKLATL